ncbi:hypothetical protein LMH73_019230 [Vibrio splendidus]|nr:hypothetical protein [Vibrio splendidus]MCC4880506.1 hypothetical protein [Vibrio splendidus]
MNYRELSRLFDDTRDDLKAESHANDTAISNFRSLISGEKSFIDSIYKKAKAELVMFSKEDGLDVFLELISTEFKININLKHMEKSTSLQVRRNTLNNLIIELNKEVKIAEEKRTKLNESRDICSEDIMVDQKNLGHLKLISAAINEIMETENANYGDLAKAKKVSLVARFLGLLTYRLHPIIATIDERMELVSAKALNGVVFSDDPMRFHEIVDQEIELASGRIGDYTQLLANLKHVDAALDSWNREINMSNRELKGLDDSGIKSTIISGIVDQIANTDEEEAFLTNLGFARNIAKKKASLIAIASLEKVVSGLQEQSLQLDKLIRQIEAPMSKLSRASRRVGSKKANFDERAFSNSINPAIASYRNMNSWSQREYQRHSSNHYNYSSMTDTNMLLWLMLMNSEDNNMAPMVLQDCVSDIQSSVMLDSSVIDAGLMDGINTASLDVPLMEMPSVDIVNFDIPRFEVPTIDIPNIEIPSSSYGSDYSGGGSYGGGGGYSSSDSGSSCSSGD